MGRDATAAFFVISTLTIPSSYPHTSHDVVTHANRGIFSPRANIIMVVRRLSMQ